MKLTPACANLRLRMALIAAFVILCVRFSSASERRFTYVYEASTAEAGEVEIENWVTWKTHPGNNPRFDQIDFRQELEFGITDRFQQSVYLADWSYTRDPRNAQRGSRYTGSALELIYQLSNPATSLGSAICGEIRGGDKLLALEGKIILQKNLGRFAFACNASVEAIWENDQLAARSGEFSQSIGVSYEIIPAFLVGGEALHEIDLPDWSRSNSSIIYAGPNVSYRHANWYLTVTPLVQLTGVKDEANLQTRLIVGVEF